MKKLFIALSAICLAVGFSACEPEDVDAFATGYRYGYYYYSSIDEQQGNDAADPNAQNAQNSVEENQ